MSILESIHRAPVSRPRIMLMMGLCGFTGVVAAGAVNAATLPEDVPSRVVHYRADSLATDRAAHQLYRRLVNAAAQVCPEEFTGSRLASPAVEQCRSQALARAVRQIGNPRLAALYANGGKSS